MFLLPVVKSFVFRLLLTGWWNILLSVGGRVKVAWETMVRKTTERTRKRRRRGGGGGALVARCGCRGDGGGCGARRGEAEGGRGETAGRPRTWWGQCACPWPHSQPASSSRNPERSYRGSLRRREEERRGEEGRGGGEERRGEEGRGEERRGEERRGEERRGEEEERRRRDIITSFCLFLVLSFLNSSDVSTSYSTCYIISVKVQ